MLFLKLSVGIIQPNKSKMPFECEAHKNAVRQGIIEAITACSILDPPEPPSEETIEKCLKQYEERYDRMKSLRSYKQKVEKKRNEEIAELKKERDEQVRILAELRDEKQKLLAEKQKLLAEYQRKIQDIEKYFDMKWGAGRIGVIPEKDPVPTFEHVLEHAKSVFGDFTTKNEQKLKMCYISYFH